MKQLSETRDLFLPSPASWIADQPQVFQFGAVQSVRSLRAEQREQSAAGDLMRSASDVFSLFYWVDSAIKGKLSIFTARLTLEPWPLEIVPVSVFCGPTMS